MPLVWLDHPVLWHGTRAHSWNLSAITPEEALLVEARWHSVCHLNTLFHVYLPHAQFYRADWDYGRTTVYLFCVAIFVFGIVNLMFQLRQRAK